MSKRKLPVPILVLSFIVSQMICSFGYALLWKGRTQSDNIIDLRYGALPQQIYDQCFLKEKNSISEKYRMYIVLAANNMLSLNASNLPVESPKTSDNNLYKKGHDVYLCSVQLIDREIKRRKLNKEVADQFKGAVIDRIASVTNQKYEMAYKLEPINFETVPLLKKTKRAPTELTTKESSEISQ